MLKKKYTILENIPPAVSMDVYIAAATQRYQEMLNDSSLDEKSFQLFFEENPSFIPGEFEAIGSSGHDAYLGTLITQPRIGTNLIRVPDFMWLANNSLSFCPVLIEIEKPSKEQFKSDDVPYAKFNQAYDQITEWKAILENPNNRQRFYDTFSIPERYQKMAFAPQYVLIYGRRSEYESEDFRREKRFQMQGNDTRIMSFDRLKPNRNSYNAITTKVSNGKYYVKHIPPTFVFEPFSAPALIHLQEFKDRIADIKMISDERRKFLLERYDYWAEFGKQDNLGLINTSDRE